MDSCGTGWRQIRTARSLSQGAVFLNLKRFERLPRRYERHDLGLTRQGKEINAEKEFVIGEMWSWAVTGLGSGFNNSLTDWT